MRFFFFLLILVFTNPSIETRSWPCMFFVAINVSNSFCRMSMINQAIPSSSKTSFNWVSNTLHLLQTYSFILPLHLEICGRKHHWKQHCLTSWSLNK
jgi:hypothetical protein